MVTIKELGDLAFRDSVIDGVPSSGANYPKKPEIRRFVAEVDRVYKSGLGGGGKTFDTLSNANANIGSITEDGGVNILNDGPNNGFYVKENGSLVKKSDATLTALDYGLTEVEKSLSSLVEALYGAKLFVVDLATTENVGRSDERLIDGVMTSSSRVLVKNQTNPVQNGIFLTRSGTWVRTADASSSTDFEHMAVYVRGGALNTGKMFICTSEAPIEILVSAITFADIDGSIQSKTDRSAFQRARIQDFAATKRWKSLPSFVLAPTPGDRLSDLGVKTLRASRASYWDRNGDLRWAEIDEPRFVFNPATGEYLGYQVEPEGRNILSHSADFTQAQWSAPRTILTPAAFTRKEMSFSTFIANGELNTHNLNRNASMASPDENGFMTLSPIIAPTGNTDRVALRLADSGVFLAYAYFNFRTGDFYTDVSGTPGLHLGITGKPVDLGDGVFSCEVTIPVTTATTSIATQIYLIEPGQANGRNWAGDGVSGVAVSNFQAERGKVATSPMINGANVVSRAPDLPIIKDGWQAPWFNAKKGTLYVEGLSREPTAEVTLIGRSGSENGLRAYLSPRETTDRFTLSASNIGSVAATGRSGVARLTSGSVVASYNGETGSLHASADLSDIANSSGTAGTTGTSGDIFIGHNADGSGSINGYIKEIAYWPTDLVASPLQDKSQQLYSTTWLSAANEVVVYVIYGQSRGRNDGTGPEVTVNPILPGIAGMFNGGVYPNARRDVPATTPVIDERIKTIVDLHEGSGIETPASGFAKGASGALQAGQRLFIINAARGGASYNQLKKGTQPWANIVTELARFKVIAANLGVTVRIGGMVFLGGEADRANTKDVYLAKLVELQRDFSSEVSALFGRQQVILFVDQISNWRGLQADMLHSEVPLAQLEFGLKHPYGRCFGPNYPYVTYDGVHYTAVESRRAGEAKGVATGNRFPLHIVKAVRTGASIVLTLSGGDDFSDIVIDTTLVTDPGNYGFEWLQTGGTARTIAAVAKSGFRQITVTLSGDPGAPTAESIAHAWTAPGGAGPTSGPRGNVRSEADWLCHDLFSIAS